ncbi:MAG: Gfo/Idh/MocA family oxidoreductase [Chitinophagales bacterium]
MSKGRVRVCLVGAGRAGMVHGLNFRQALPEADLVAVVDADRSAAEASARNLSLQQGYTTLSEAAEKVPFEAVVIGAPTFVHCEVALEAAALGKHILCEKPMATTLEECDSMAGAAQRAGVILQLGFMRRFDRNFQLARTMVESGEIGEVTLVRSLTRGPGLPPPWYYDLRRSNGLLAEVNSHDCDTLRWFGGSEVEQVFAQAGAFYRPDIRAEHPDFYDCAVVNLRYASGRFGVIDGACPAEYGYDSRLEVVGTKGMVFVGQMHEENVVTCTKTSGVVRPIGASWRVKYREAYLAEDRHFVDCVLKGDLPLVGAAEGRAALAIVLAANRSIAEGVPVKLVG